MIDFQPISSIDKSTYESYLFNEKGRGCELSYANLNMWGEQKVAILHNHLVIFTKYNEHYFYPFPLGNGDKKLVLDAILQDAKERKISYRISSLTPESAKLLETLYPEKFSMHFNRDSFDYVYEIEKLAELKGRKYHRKRNHYNHFCKNFPNFHVEALNKNNLPQVQAFLSEWYQKRLEDSPENDYHNEQIALDRCFRDYIRLGMESLILFHDNEIFAFTMGSRLSNNTFDVHFEKARWDVEGAYTAINCEFAKYIRNKYPEVEFLDREEDLGIEGLRKAKESYFPHHLVEKGTAIPVFQNTKINA